MPERDVYPRLGKHLSMLGMGWPETDVLIEILSTCFTETEAAVALAVPTGVIPLQPVGVDTIIEYVDLERVELIEILERLVEKRLLYTGLTEEGEPGYALQQVGFGFPQAFFWSGDDTPGARKMAGLVAKYFNRHVTARAYSAETKAYRYIPVGRSLELDLQAVYPRHMMEYIIENTQQIALTHCPCRVTYKLLGRECRHPTEVCMKFDEMAGYVIDQGLGRKITKEEARRVIRDAEEAGLVHFVDNTEHGVKHNCNCCGCACWNVGNIRRRKIPRDVIMAVYFMRTTDEDECTGCGACVDICPVNAVEVSEGPARVDEEWCIGCGVCAAACPTGAVAMRLREDRDGALPAPGFKELHEKILREKNG